MVITVGEHADGGRGDTQWRFLHVNVTNVKRTGRKTRLLPARQSAFSCRAWITYEVSADNRPFSIDGRWVSTGEPVSLLLGIMLGKDGVPDQDRVQMIPAFDPSKVPAGQREDIPLGSTAVLNIAVKYEGEQEAYAFNNWSYAYREWKNPSWKLPQGDVTIKVRVNSGGKTFEESFAIQNPGAGSQEFRLVPQVTRPMS